jgi:hypothetical protein
MKKIITICLIFFGIALAQAQNKFQSTKLSKLYLKSNVFDGKSKSSSTLNPLSKKYWLYDTIKNSWVINSIYDYDSISNILMETKKDWTYGFLCYAERNVSYLNSKNKKDSCKTNFAYDISYKNFQQQSKVVTSYNNSNIENEVITYNWNGMNFINQYRDSFSYSPNLNIVYRYNWGSSWYLNSYDSIELDSKGRIIFYKVYAVNNSNLVANIVFSYDTIKNIREINVNVGSINSTLNKSKTISKFNQFNSLVYEVNYSWDSLNQIYFTTDSLFNDFDLNNNLVSSVNYFSLNNIWIRQDSTHYYYLNPNCISSFQVNFDTLSNTFVLTIPNTVLSQATAYNWDFGDGTFSTQQYPNHNYLIDSIYNVCLTVYSIQGDSCTYCHIIGKDYQGHIIKSAGFNLNVKGQSNIGVNEIINEKTELMVYPNPVNNVLICKYANLLMNTIEITDVLGRVMLRNEASIQQINNSSTQQISIHVAELPHGVYFIKATDEKGNVKNAKFVKE